MTSSGKYGYHAGSGVVFIPSKVLTTLIATGHIPRRAAKGASKALSKKTREFIRDYNSEAIEFYVENKTRNPKYFIPPIVVPNLNSTSPEGAANQGIEAIVSDWEGTWAHPGDDKIEESLVDKFAEYINIFGTKKFVILSNLAGTLGDNIDYAGRVERNIKSQLEEKGVYLEDNVKVVRHTAKKPAEILELKKYIDVPFDRVLYLGDTSKIDTAFANRNGMHSVMAIYFPTAEKDGKKYASRGDGSRRKDAQKILYLARGDYTLGEPVNPIIPNFNVDYQEIAPGNMLPHVKELKDISHIYTNILHSLFLVTPLYLPTGYINTFYVDDGKFNPADVLPWNIEMMGLTPNYTKIQLPKSGKN